jgi:hypothetical protein
MKLDGQELTFMYKTTGLLVPLYGCKICSHIKFKVFVAVEKNEIFSLNKLCQFGVEVQLSDTFFFLCLSFRAS